MDTAGPKSRLSVKPVACNSIEPGEPISWCPKSSVFMFECGIGPCGEVAMTDGVD